MLAEFYEMRLVLGAIGRLYFIAFTVYVSNFFELVLGQYN